MNNDPVAVVERYLAVVADLDATAEALGQCIHPGARFVERPNLVAPTGRRRDAACSIAAFGHSRALLAEQRIDVVDHLAVGDRVVTQATWTGRLAVDAGTLPAGTELRADCCMVFTVRDGRIHHQDNYDCYHPVDVPAAAT